MPKGNVVAKQVANKKPEETKVMVREDDHAASAKPGAKYSTGRITTFCRNGRYAERIGAGTPIYLAAVL